MEKLRKISALLLVGLISVTVMAQEKKMLTLEDVIPGGETYHQFRPENIYGLQWWGDICVKPDMEDIKTIDPRTGKENVIATLEEVNHRWRKTLQTITSVEAIATFYECYISMDG